MPIYTGRGDQGLTDLRDMTRVSKTDPRIEAYGTVDELNALVGTVLPTAYDDVNESLRSIQNHLHIVQAEFANPENTDDDPVITPGHIETLEGWMDDAETELDPLRSFILPGGGPDGAALHHARAVCRRAERRAVALANHDDTVDDRAIVYLNRLSDALFVFARLVNSRDGAQEHAPTY